MASLVALAVLWACVPAWSQTLPALPEPVRIQMNSSPNLVGSGARALGMGGAFIAVADDATSASWNPGGLTQLERPEMSVVYAWKWFREDFRRTSYVEPMGRFQVALDDLNYLSLVYPIRRTIAGRNLVFSLNYQRQYDFDMTRKHVARDVGANPWQVFGDFGVRIDGRDMSFQRGPVKVDSDGGLGSLSPAFGFELTDRISVGMVANLWDSSLIPNNEWTVRTSERPTLIVNRAYDLFQNGRLLNRVGIWYLQRQISEKEERYEDFDGTNYTFGLLCKPTERLSIGAVYHTKFAATVKYTKMETSFGRVTSNWPGPAVNIFDFDYDEKKLRIEYPSAIGLGLAYRFPNDKLTLSLDVTRREWDEYVVIDPRRGRMSPITGLPKWRSAHDPTYTVRLGGEYVFVDPSRPKQKLLPSVRAGLFYDPEPASGRKDGWWGITKGDGSVDDYYGVALGLGLLIANRVNLDAAYQYRWGNDVRRDIFANNIPFERGFHEDVEQHQLYLSTVIYF